MTNNTLLSEIDQITEYKLRWYIDGARFTLMALHYFPESEQYRLIKEHCRQLVTSVAKQPYHSEDLYKQVMEYFNEIFKDNTK